MDQSEPVQWGSGHPMFFLFFFCHAPHRMKLAAAMIFAVYDMSGENHAPRVCQADTY